MYNDILLGCTNCVPPCLTCSKKDKCKDCIDKYYFNEGTCNQCKPECLKCSSLNICSECTEGYYLTQ